MLLMSYGGGTTRPNTVSSSSSSSLAFGMAGHKKTDDAEPSQDGGVSAVVREIELEPSVARVEEARFWQVHYGLAMANLKLRLVGGCDDGTLSAMRNRVARMINNRLEEGYGRGSSLRWEVTVQTSVDGS